MCGIFGLVRASGAPPELASEAFVMLGCLAVERGTDASGVALVSGPPGCTPATRDDAAGSDRTVDGVRVVKGILPFAGLWDAAVNGPGLDAAQVAFGHTRWATQGSPGDMLNASPMHAGCLVGTHNGDCDIEGFSAASRGGRFGQTDTEALFLELSAAGGRTADVVRVLTDLRGRAALAWVDRRRPGTVTLARAGLSPLATAHDREGNFYWASNPGWFRQVDRATDGAFGFDPVRLVPEGTVLTAVAGPTVTLTVAARFTPTVRAADMLLAPLVWRGFDPQDQADDQAAAVRMVEPWADRPA